MHCYRLAEELKDISAKNALDNLTPETKSHLESCADCQQEAKRIQELGKLFTEAYNDEQENIPSFEQMHQPLKEQTQTRSSVTSTLAQILGQFSKPRLGYALAAIALALAIVSLTKFYNPKTAASESIIGYEVTFTGVQKDLAENPESICDLLSRLELFEANIDSISCEQFCKLSIIDLQSAEDASRVVEAFSKFGRGYKSVQVAPVTAPTNKVTADS